MANKGKIRPEIFPSTTDGFTGLFWRMFSGNHMATPPRPRASPRYGGANYLHHYFSLCHREAPHRERRLCSSAGVWGQSGSMKFLVFAFELKDPFCIFRKSPARKTARYGKLPVPIIFLTGSPNLQKNCSSFPHPTGDPYILMRSSFPSKIAPLYPQIFPVHIIQHDLSSLF